MFTLCLTHVFHSNTCMCIICFRKTAKQLSGYFAEYRQNALCPCTNLFTGMMLSSAQAACMIWLETAFRPLKLAPLLTPPSMYTHLQMFLIAAHIYNSCLWKHRLS
ncbi:TPA: hypothetical protein ACH3X2_009603 [Trebouxia sp. C0005]